MDTPEELKTEIGNDLSALQRILSKFPKVFQQVESLAPPIASAWGNRKEKREDWAYELTGLRFNLPDPKYAWPGDAKALQAELSVKIAGRWSENLSADPLTVLEVNLSLMAALEEGKQITYHHVDWHLDRHQVGGEPKKGAAGGGTIDKGKSGESGSEKLHDSAVKKPAQDRGEHPLYHLTACGNVFRDRAAAKEAHYGNFLALDSPRVAYPPLDAVLAVDFVLTHFYLPLRKTLIDEHSDYRDAVRHAQRRLWVPYFVALGRWAEAQEHAWSPMTLWPNLFEIPSTAMTEGEPGEISGRKG